MTGFGAIVKTVVRWVEGMISAAGHDLRRGLRDRRPKLNPIPVVEDARERRR